MENISNINYKKELPDKFNIIIEAYANLSTQMNEKNSSN